VGRVSGGNLPLRIGYVYKPPLLPREFKSLSSQSKTCLAKHALEVANIYRDPINFVFLGPGPLRLHRQAPICAEEFLATGNVRSSGEAALI
jgi:hypothetical protein